MKPEAPFRGRLEDERLVTGRGRYGDDLNLTGQVYAAFLRSPVAHARIISIDAGRALACDGVVAVLTGADFSSLGYGKIPVLPQQNADGSAMVVPDWPPLACDRVRFVGESIALVLAESTAAAQAALESIVFELDELQPVARPGGDGEPVWPHAPDNVALRYHAGDKPAVDRAFAAAAHVVTASVLSQRLVVNAMETRAVAAEWDAASGTFRLHAGSQGATGLSAEVAALMNLPPSAVRVTTCDVGGGFGSKTHAYPDYATLLEASRRIGRPVKWTPSRSEAFLTDSHGRDSVIEGDLALDATGRFLAFRFRSTVNIGAYHTSFTTFTATRNFFNSVAGVYRTPAIQADISCVYTNTNPTAPYRGAGRPEANLILERLVDAGSAATGLDRAEIRRRNLVPASAMPYRAANGMVYCSGDFPAVLEKALALADYGGFPQRRAIAQSKGKLLGLGIACYLEIAGVIPVEDLRLDVDGAGLVSIASGLQSNGQGHETVLRQLVSERLGIAPGLTHLADGDSARVPGGVGSFASRSMMVGGAAAILACEKLVDQAIAEAARLLQTPADRLSYVTGKVFHRDTGQSLSLAEIVRQSGALSVLATCNVPPTFPNGCHIAEVEIDRDSGSTRIVRFVAVDDVGNRINPTLVDGQLHGGIAQGLGQFLLEEARYDEASGQLLTGSFMDYAMPRADDLPSFLTDHVDVPSPNNPLGAKGVGEAGTSGALAAAYNALLDALSSFGIDRFDMPATAPRVWQAMNGANSKVGSAG